MCTALISNRSKTIVGWNLDIRNYEYRVTTCRDRVAIEILDAKEGWMPLFGANSRGNFVAMPTCWPPDKRSNPSPLKKHHIICLDIDMLFARKSLKDIQSLAQQNAICSIPDLTFQAQLSDEKGNVLQVIPGQGYRYLKQPRFAVMANFSPLKMNRETHPAMGWDRYNKATELLQHAHDNFGVQDCFYVLNAVSQQDFPTVISMVFDVSQRQVFWKYPQQNNSIEKYQLDFA